MTGIKSFASIGHGRLLGFLPNQSYPLQSLLGDAYDPRAARMRLLGGTLQGLGIGLAAGKPGAWAQGAVLGGQQALDDYQQTAIDTYRLKTAQDERDYQRARDATADERWQQQWDYNVGRQQKADEMDATRFGWEVNAHENPPPAPLPNEVQLYEYGLNNPGFAEYQTQLKRAGAPSVSVDTQGNAYEKARGASLSKAMDDYEAAERSAYDTLGSVEVMRNVMRDPSFYSGWGGNAVLGAKQFLTALGGDPNAAASSETFNVESKRMALANMGGSLGAGFSNADRDFVTTQVANLANTPQGNHSLLDINSRIARRKIQIAQMARDYEIRNGRIDSTFKQQLSKWALENPLFEGFSAVNRGQPAPNSDPFNLRNPVGGR